MPEGSEVLGCGYGCEADERRSPVLLTLSTSAMPRRSAGADRVFAMLDDELEALFVGFCTVSG